MSPGLPVDWRRRAVPLEPHGALAFGSAAKALGRRVLSLDRSDLRGLATAEVLLVIGDGLPWVDGVVYVAPDPDAPELWTPTTEVPNRHPALVVRALAAQLDLPTPLLAAAGTAFPLGEAQALSPLALAAWVAR